MVGDAANDPAQMSKPKRAAVHEAHARRDSGVRPGIRERQHENPATADHGPDRRKRNWNGADDPASPIESSYPKEKAEPNEDQSTCDGQQRHSNSERQRPAVDLHPDENECQPPADPNEHSRGGGGQDGQQGARIRFRLIGLVIHHASRARPVEFVATPHSTDRDAAGPPSRFGLRRTMLGQSGFVELRQRIRFCSRCEIWTAPMAHLSMVRGFSGRQF